MGPRSVTEARATPPARSTEPRHHRECANDNTSGDDDDAADVDDVLRGVERARVPLRKEFQEETATDWRARMQSRLHVLQETSRASERVVFRIPRGHVITREYFLENGFEKAIVAASPEQVGLQVPGPGMSLDELKKNIGSERPIRAIDVASQLELAEDWKLKEWVAFFGRPASERSRILNLLSLECGSSKLARLVKPPTVVKEIGWVESMWPKTNKADRARMPRVQLYTLMSCAESYTDFHVDFCGSSVWYHLYKGRKIFLLIPPTDANLRAYFQFQAHYKFGESDFLADHMDDVSLVEVRAGETFLLPSGWIHAVYTPEDSIAFGGNFLTGYHIQMQLRCHAIEDALHVAKQFRFPEFEAVHWYAAAFYARNLQVSKSTKKAAVSSAARKPVISKWELKELKTLTAKLEKWLDSESSSSSQDTDAANSDTSESLSPSEPGVQKDISVTRICKSAGRFASPRAMLESIRSNLELQSSQRVDAASAHLPPALATVAAAAMKISLNEAGSSPCPSTTSNTSSSDSSVSSDSSSESSSSVSDNSSPSDSESDEKPDKEEQKEDENKDDDEKTGDEDGSDSDSSTSSSSSSSSSSSNHEAAPPVVEANAVEGESSTSDSDGSDLENAYPRLPPAPVDALLAIRKIEKLDEMKITGQTKEEIIQQAWKHQQERLEQLKRNKKKSTSSLISTSASSSSSKSKKKKKSGLHDQQDVTMYQENASSSQNVHVSVGIAGGEDQEDWIVHCSCGMSGKNIDDGTNMTMCEKCSQWVHTRCALKPGDTELDDDFVCFKCEKWYFRCKCGKRGANLDDGELMIECDVCNIWQHAVCAGIEEGVPVPEKFECSFCKKSRSKQQQQQEQQRPSSASSKKQRSRKQQPGQRRRSNSSQSTGAAAAVPPPPAPSSETKAATADASDRTPLPPSSPPPQAPASALAPPPPPPMPPSPPPPPSMAPPAVSRTNGSSEKAKRKSSPSDGHRKRSSSGSKSSSGDSKSSSKKRSTASGSSSHSSSSSRKPSGAHRTIDESSSSQAAAAGILTELSVVARPPLPNTPKSSSSPFSNGGHAAHGWSSGSSSGSKRKSESARERLEKKLKKKKMR